MIHHILKRKKDKKSLAFTLVELLIVMVIVGILSTLLFRSLGDMTRIAGRIEFEKILSQNLISIHTITNYLSEQYPHIDMTKYENNNNLNNWYTTGLYLIANNKHDTASLILSGDGLWLQESKNNTNTAIFDEKKIGLTGWMIRIVPTVYYTGSIYNLPTENINAGGFRLFWSLYPKAKDTLSQKLSLNLQHFVHLKP